MPFSFPSSSDSFHQKPVFTAIALYNRHDDDDMEDEDDVHSMITQPLLTTDHEEEYAQQQQQHQQRQLQQYMTDETIVVLLKKPSKKTTKTMTEDAWSCAGACHADCNEGCGDNNSSNHQGRFVILGALTGFLIQIVSLGAYALLLLHYNNVNNKDTNDQHHVDILSWWPSLHDDAQTDNVNDVAAVSVDGSTAADADWKHMLVNVDWFVYGILSVLTQIDLVIYVLIWIAFTCTMTRNGMNFLRFQYQNPQLRRRWVFVLGVYFLVGIVLGAFTAWSMIDVYLGFPIPFMPIVATVAIDLVLCYMMVCCYDLGRGGRANTSINSHKQLNLEQDDDNEDDDESCVCC